MPWLSLLLSLIETLEAFFLPPRRALLRTLFSPRVEGSGETSLASPSMPVSLAGDDNVSGAHLHRRRNLEAQQLMIAKTYVKKDDG